MRIVASGLQFPEGPIALDDGSVLVVEIARETLSRIRPDGTVDVVASIPGGPNGAALGPDGRVYVCNNGGYNWVRDGNTLRPHGQPSNWKTGSIEVVDLTTGRVERLYDKVGEYSLRGPNDLVFDAFGGFYFTDIGKRRLRDADRGFVYYAKSDGSQIKEVVTHAIAPNGIGLSPDGHTLYVAETDTGRIWAWDIIEPGELRKLPWPSPCGGRLIIGLGGYARFDSLAISAQGNICAAVLDECCLVEVNPQGQLLRRHAFPDMMVTNICFGGDDLRTAFVTLSNEGRLVCVPWHEPGLRLNCA